MMNMAAWGDVCHLFTMSCQIPEMVNGLHCSNQADLYSLDGLQGGPFALR